MTRLRAESGFTLVELLVAMAITMTVIGAVVATIVPTQHAFSVQPESADLIQRVRVGADRLTKDLLLAGAGLMSDEALDMYGAPVLPYRTGLTGSDAAAGVPFRPDTISVAHRLPLGAALDTPTLVRHTYFLKASTFQLMHDDGLETDLPVLDDVVALAFDYFTDSGSFASGTGRLDPGVFIDGPWRPDEAHPARFDVDLLSIRRIRVRLRVQAHAAFRGPAGVLFSHAGVAPATRYVPDQEIRFDVAPRNM